MTCGLHTDFNAATDAVKKAFKTALDADTLDENTLGEVWRHYQGLKTCLLYTSPSPRDS